MKCPIFTLGIAIWAAATLQGAESGRNVFTALASGQANVIVSRDGAEYLSFGTAVWGPSWQWTSVEGKVQSQNQVASGSLSAMVGGKRLALDFKASRPATNRLQLEYALTAGSNVDLTLFAVEFKPGKTFVGRPMLAISEGKTNAVKPPFALGTIGSQVRELRLTDRQGKTTVVQLDPPCEITSDGAARILMAKDHMEAGTRRLTLSVELPGATDWYASVADMPDLAGIETWYPWQATGETAGSILGMEDWMEHPAGKFGRIQRKKDQLMYHSQPIKLWGLNLCYGTCAPEKSLADKRALFYRSHGINAVRLHKFADNTGWSGIQAKDTCVDYDAAGLERMDYQVAKFKEAGIYVNLSAHFGSLKLGTSDKQYVPYQEEFGKYRDGRIETPHSAIHYSPELQTVQILQMVNLLKHKNPHTGLTYAEDPAIAFIEIINEQSILFYTTMAPLQASATLRQSVGKRFCDWLRLKYNDQDGLVKSWSTAAFDCFAKDGFKSDGENLDKNNILPLGNPWYWDPEQLKGSQAPKKQRLLDTLEFLYGLECEFYDRYVAAMREAGYTGEIVASNWQAGRAFSHFANLHADARVGTVDRHNYFDGDKANATMLMRAGSGILSSGMQQVSDKPFMISEWIHVFPSEYVAEGPSIIAAYGMGLQGWDASFMFQNGDNGSYSPKIGRDQWDVTAPTVMGLFPAIARQIYRGDVKQSEVVATRHVHVPSLFKGQLGFEDKVTQGYDDKELDSSAVPARALVVVRSVVEFDETNQETLAFDMRPFVRDDGIASFTKQLFWNEGDDSKGGFCTVNTEGTKAVIGFTQGRKNVLGNVTIKSASDFSVIYVTARDYYNTIDTTRDLLVIAMARARNTGMKFSPAGDKMLAAGAAPILMEPVKATLEIHKKGTPTVYLLDHDGKPTDKTLPIVNGRVSIDTARDKTPYYLIRYLD